MTMIALGASPRNAWRISDGAVDLVRRPAVPTVAEIAAEPQRVRLDLRRTACIVIDMQNDFCAPGGWLDHIGVDIAPARRPIAPLQRILPELRRAQVPVIWLNWGNRPDRLNLSPSLLHVYKPNGRGVGLGDPLPGSGAPVLEKGSWAAGEGIAHADGNSVPLKRGDSLLLPAGTIHQIENTGTTRLYCLTVMVPNQDFAELIRAGEPVAIDDEDWAVLLGA